MSDFLLFLDELRSSYKLHAVISYSSITDWCIYVYRKGAGDFGSDVVLCYEQDCDMQLAFAKAHVALKEKLSELYGGY